MATSKHESAARAKCSRLRSAGGKPDVLARYTVLCWADLAFGTLEVQGAHSISQVSFFNNDLDTQTQGVDVVATYAIDSGAGLTEFSVSPNRNRTRVTEIPTRIGRDGNPFTFVNEEAVFDTENALSKTQGAFALRHWRGRFDVMGRVHWCGDYRHANTANFADPENVQRVSGKILVDLQASWRASDTFSVTLGGQNVLGQTPDEAEFEACCSRIYRTDSMISWQGAYYFLNVGADF